MANPLGVDQALNSAIMGRFELRSGANFNRAWPDLVSGLADSVRKRLGKDADENVELVRRELKRRIAALQPENPMMAQRIALARRAYDADLVVDLHCDDEALPYMMAPDELWDEAKRFAADVGVHSLQPNGESNGAHCFDECFLEPWQALHKEFGERVPLACHAFTFEMGGVLDVDPKQAQRYAQGFVRYLRRIGCIEGAAPTQPRQRASTSSARSRCWTVPPAGSCSIAQELGDWVSPGDVLAEIVDPTAPDLDTEPSSHQGQHEGLRRLAPAVAAGRVRRFRGDARRP